MVHNFVLLYHIRRYVSYVHSPYDMFWCLNISCATFFFCSGVTNTPRGGVVNCGAQVKFLGIPFRSQRTLGAHPSLLGIGVLSSSWSVAPPSSQTSPNVNGCVVQGPIGIFHEYPLFFVQAYKLSAYAGK